MVTTIHPRPRQDSGCKYILTFGYIMKLMIDHNQSCDRKAQAFLIILLLILHHWIIRYKFWRITESESETKKCRLRPKYVDWDRLPPCLKRWRTNLTITCLSNDRSSAYSLWPQVSNYSYRTPSVTQKEQKAEPWGGICFDHISSTYMSQEFLTGVSCRPIVTN